MATMGYHSSLLLAQEVSKQVSREILERGTVTFAAVEIYYKIKCRKELDLQLNFTPFRPVFHL